MRILPVLALLGMLLSPLLGRAAPLSSASPVELAYAVLKDGERIGAEIHHFTRNGDGLTVDVVNKTKVAVLFVTFTYDHQRTELWRGGKLVELTSTTNDDGTSHSFAMKRDGQGFHAAADGKNGDLPDTALPVTMWTKEILTRSTLYGVADGVPQAVRVEKLGPETLLIRGKETEADHYRLTGALERDLWYAPDGTFLKTRFLKRGYVIEFVLQ